jgi:hypothetical protein
MVIRNHKKRRNGNSVGSFYEISQTISCFIFLLLKTVKLWMISSILLIIFSRAWINYKD